MVPSVLGEMTVKVAHPVSILNVAIPLKVLLHGNVTGTVLLWRHYALIPNDRIQALSKKKL